MRLIASFEEEKKAYALYSLLLKGHIESVYEALEDPVTKVIKYPVWIINEEDIDHALDIYEAFQQDPETFLKQEMRELSSSEEPTALGPTDLGPIKVQATSHLVRVRSQAPLTRFVIVVCILMFFWSWYQEDLLEKKYPALMEYFGLTTFTMQLLYDEPAVFDEVYQFFIKHPELKPNEIDQWPPAVKQEINQLDKEPFWKGLYTVVVDWPSSKAILQAPLFTKISEGELWRLFTPVLLHGNFLHILFNMLWLWMLGKEMELRIGKMRYVFLMIVIGVISNTAQYLVAGPMFLGYSGVICGLGGFIWMRQKKAPWEGYIIPRGTLLFLFIFIIGMVVLQTIAVVASKMHLGEFPVGNIGNTAHIVGLICGLALARVPLFYRIRS